MSTPIDDGGPAFPAYNDADKEYHYCRPGMSLRDWSCVQLRVPATGKPWLDELIEEARRDWFAGRALSSMTAAPETDAEGTRIRMDVDIPLSGELDAALAFSRKLERERDELRAEVERLRIRLTHFTGLIQSQRDTMKG